MPKAPTTRESQVHLNDDQRHALKLAQNNAHKFHLFYGGGGSGKSFFILYLMVLRALSASNSRHIAIGNHQDCSHVNHDSLNNANCHSTPHVH